MTVCPTVPQDYKPWQNGFDRVFNSIYLGFSLIVGAVMIAFTVTFFKRRRPEERPCFVILWIICMHIFWVCWVAFFLDLLHFEKEQPDFL